MKFKEFLLENQEKHGVLAFGRMNPPTTGHEVLVNKAKEVAKKVGGEHHIVLSGSHDPKKNPLTPEQKIKHAKRAFPNTNITAASKEEPTFLQHAAKLHKAGVTHLHMVAGSDRVKEYHDKLHQYNGTHGKALYNFKKITVHSAGERDPDAEGTEGMSASKMRGHAASGQFHEFRKGIPAHVSHEHAKELYNDVRKGMGIKESVQFSSFIKEGVHDRGIFKAVFMAGGPGSGKDFVMKSIFGEVSNNSAYASSTASGMTEINSDKAFEYLMDKHGLDKKMPESEDKQRNILRGKAKNIRDLRQRLAISGRNGLIINGTGDDPEKISKIKDMLTDLGYETKMILVSTTDKTSQIRNARRGDEGGRSLKEPDRKEKWQNVQKARTPYVQMFGNDYIEVDNETDLRDPEVADEVKQQKYDELKQIYKDINKWIDKPVNNEDAKGWIGKELGKKDTGPTEKREMPTDDSDIAAQAKRMGLEYYGFGRYGKNNQVLYHSVHRRLVPVVKGVKEDINNDFSKIISESYELSDASSKNLMLLGTEIQEDDTETRVSVIDLENTTESVNEIINREVQELVSEERTFDYRRNSNGEQSRTSSTGDSSGTGRITEEAKRKKENKKISLNTLRIKMNIKPQNIDDEFGFGKTDQDDAIDGPEYIRPPLGSNRDELK